MVRLRKRDARLSGCLSSGMPRKKQSGSMGNVLAADYYRILVLQQPPGDQARYARALLQLPALPWEIEGETEVTEAAVRALVLDNPDIRMRSADETIARYRELRAIGGRLATEVLEIAGATVIMESARALGFMHGNTLVLDNEDEMAYILDYALYANPHQRDRYLQAYLDAHPVLDAESRLFSGHVPGPVLPATVQSHHPGDGTAGGRVAARRTISPGRSDAGENRSGRYDAGDARCRAGLDQ